VRAVADRMDAAEVKLLAGRQQAAARVRQTTLISLLITLAIASAVVSRCSAACGAKCSPGATPKMRCAPETATTAASSIVPRTAWRF